MGGTIFKFCFIVDNIDDCSSELTVFCWPYQSLNSSHNSCLDISILLFDSVEGC